MVQYGSKKERARVEKDTDRQGQLTVAKFRWENALLRGNEGTMMGVVKEIGRQQ